MVDLAEPIISTCNELDKEVFSIVVENNERS